MTTTNPLLALSHSVASLCLGVFSPFSFEELGPEDSPLKLKTCKSNSYTCFSRQQAARC